ncbi:dihydrofolate reductase [Candidatus Peregrinibacteria bacterium]|nr:dihydrofolate reductase [Candidatus Peregrinibacteria bacterium]
MNHPLYLIAAADSRNGIGIHGRLPWSLKGDLQFFQEITERTEDLMRKNMIIMGWVTWESLPAGKRPLPGRHNVVLNLDSRYTAPGATVFTSLETALQSADKTIEKIFVIGGGRTYREAILHPDVTGVYLTRVQGDFNCDTFFPPIPKRFNHIQRLGAKHEKNIAYEFLLYTA